jgi:hypothetical protein
MLLVAMGVAPDSRWDMDREILDTGGDGRMVDTGCWSVRS